MVELVVNDIVDNYGLKQYLVLDELTVLQNYEKIFGSAGLSGIHNAFKIYGGSSFYEIKRYFQYIGILKYTGEYHSLTMSMFDIENVDNYLDSFKLLSDANWSTDQLNKIGDIYQEILNDKNLQLASIKINKLI